MKPIFVFIFLLHSFFCYSQNPSIKMWDYRYGGIKYDRLTSFNRTTDGGFILGGWSNSSIGGDKTQDTIGMYDYWLVKTDRDGNKRWDKTFGGTDMDIAFPVIQTRDGGYLIGGFSRSGISGDKTEPTWGFDDYWIVKIDSLGNKEWDKDFGGTEMDLLYTLIQTDDGGYILGGYSFSGISGTKTQPNYDSSLYTCDFWIVKIDSIGNKLWDKVYGGVGGDQMYGIQETSDNGFVLSGSSSSSISGDITQDNWDTIYPYSADFWMIKIDSIGNKEWDKRFGGTEADVNWNLKKTVDGGYILAGHSSSGMNGDKSEASWGNSDYWIVKTDSLGNKLWDKDFGGDDMDEIWSIQQTNDKGYLIGGESHSDISGNKTENNLGEWQTWIVRIDSSGNFQWDKTLLVDGKSTYGYAIELEEGCYIFADDVQGSVSGYKSQSNWDTTNLTKDFWVIKFCDSLHTDVNPIPDYESSYRVYPNPTSEILILEIRFNENFDVTIFNSFGQEVFIAHNEDKINIQALSSGFYTIVISQNGKVFRNKFVKN